MSIQETIYKLESGTLGTWLKRLAGLALLIGLFVWFGLTHFNGLGSMEEMDYAQLARSLARGEGFHTQFIRPLALGQFRDLTYTSGPQGKPLLPGEQAPALPIDLFSMQDSFNPPFYPVCLSLVFRLFGTPYDHPPAFYNSSLIYFPEWLIVGFNGLCFVLSGGLLFLLANRLFDLRVAIGTGVLFFVCELIWRFTFSGYSTMLTLLLLLASFTALHEVWLAQEEERPATRWLWTFLGALFLALSVLTRYQMLWFVPLYCLALLWPLRSRWSALLVTLAIIIGVVMPWTIRNVALTHSPLGHAPALIGYNGNTYPGSTLYRSYRLNPEALLWKEGMRKLLVGARYSLVQGYVLTGACVGTLFFVVGGLHGFRRLRVNLLRILVLAGATVLGVGGALVVAEPESLSETNELVLFVPLLLMFGVAYFYILLDRLDLSHELLVKSIVGLFLGVGALPLALLLLRPQTSPIHYPPYYPQVIKGVAGFFNKDEVLLSDIPWATAWYGDRASVWIPVSMKEFFEINDSLHPISGLLLTPQTGDARLLNEISKGEWKEWSSIITRAALPNGFPLTTITPLPPNQDEYFLLADRVRWK